MKILTKLICGLVLVAATVSSQALNYDPAQPAPAPVLNAGWTYDQVNGPWINSVDSPYAFALPGPAMFTITDDFIPGDTYKVWDFGGLILTTGLTPGGQPFPQPPGGPAFTWGSVNLAAGPHFLTVQGDGVGGIPAGFYTRLDTIPEAGSLVLLGAALWAGLLALRRRN